MCEIGSDLCGRLAEILYGRLAVVSDTRRTGTYSIHSCGQTGTVLSTGLYGKILVVGIRDIIRG